MDGQVMVNQRLSEQTTVEIGSVGNEIGRSLFGYFLIFLALLMRDHKWGALVGMSRRSSKWESMV